MALEAVKVALDPTPAQERLMLSHAGWARFLREGRTDIAVPFLAKAVSLLNVTWRVSEVSKR